MLSGSSAGRPPLGTGFSTAMHRLFGDRDRIPAPDAQLPKPHCNLDQQMRVAESLFDPKAGVEQKSRLTVSLTDLQNDVFVQAYFDAYATTLSHRTGDLIKLWTSVCRFRTLKAFSPYFELEDVEYAVRKGLNMLKRCANNEDIAKVLDQKWCERLEERMERAELDAGMFDPVLHSISSLAEVTFISFLTSHFFLKYQIDLMTKGQITLSDILFHDGSVVHFRQFMEQHEMGRYVHFLLVVQSCRSSADIECHSVWKKFFEYHPNSKAGECSHYLHLSEGVSGAVRQAILRQESDCFRAPALLIHQYLQQTYFDQFIESRSYCELRTKLIERFQQMQMANQTASATRCESLGELSMHDSTSSDRVTGLPSNSTNATPECVSERSASPAGQSMARRMAGLQILHVDRYGRLISDLEPDPDKRQERSYISQSIRKLVRRSVSNQDANHAMAWERAQMIIDDIVNVTATYT